MSGNTYLSPAQRVGIIRGKILQHAIHSSTLEISGEIYEQPVGQGDTVIFQQTIPFGATAASPNQFSTTAAAHLIQEGVTPNPDSISVINTTAVVSQYGCLYTYTDKTEKLGEAPISDRMTEQIGERLGLVRELVYSGALQGCTNRFYSGGTTRLTTDEPVTKNLIDRVVRNLNANHAKYTRNYLSSSNKYGTVSLQKSYFLFAHTDLKADFEALPGFKLPCDYGTMELAHEMEAGSIGNVRVILSPDLPKIADAGAAIAGTSNMSTSGTNADIYQMFVIAKDAWGHTAFRGLDAFKFNHLKPSDIDKSDPTGARGYVAATFYDAGVVTNHGWMAVAEVTASSLT